MPVHAVIEEELEIPEGVKVEIEKGRIKVAGKKGELETTFNPNKIYVAKKNGKIVFKTYFPNRREKAYLYTVKAHVRNMIDGVTRGFRYKMKMVYAHFPFSVEVKGNTAYIKNFLGEKTPRIARIEEGVKVYVDGDDVIIEGIDKYKVGQTAANIRAATKIKDKDPLTFMDGIYLYEKGYQE